MNRYFFKFILALILEKEEYIIKYKKCIKNSNKKNLPISFFFFYLLAFFQKVFTHFISNQSFLFYLIFLVTLLLANVAMIICIFLNQKMV